MKREENPLEALGQALGGRGGRPEAWAWVAFAHAALLILLALYLGLRPGGRGPIYAYAFGRDLLALSALATLFVGLMWSLLHRPLWRRRRALALVTLVLVIGAASFPMPYPSPHEDHPSTLCFRLPCEDEWTVFWGGEKRAENRLAAYFPDRRWGLDLVVTVGGRTHRGAGLDVEDYYAWGREVLAPAAGVVVRVVDGIEDTPPRTFRRGPEPFGNHVVLEVAESRYVFLAHLLSGSIRVVEGQRVEAGERLARVGNSGFSAVTPEPHLALHLQDTPEPRRGEAVPWSFCRYAADGFEVERGLPTGGVTRDGLLVGQRVRPLSE